MPTARTTAQPAEGRREEAYLLDIEREVPGFGGYYADADGTLHVIVGPNGNAERARAAVREQFTSGRMPRTRGAVPNVVIERGRFAFSTLAGWREQLFDYAVSSTAAGIHGLDVDEARNRIRVDYLGDLPALKTRIASLGIDTTAVHFQLAQPMKMTATRRQYPTTINDSTSPVVGGVGMYWQTSSGSEAGGCTIGFTATVSGVARFVSAAHCSAIRYNTDGALVRQPYNASGRFIGQEISDPAGYNCGSYICRGSDASLFSFNSGVTSSVGLLARTTTRNNGGAFGNATTLAWDSSNPYWVIDAVEQDNWFVGLAVDKSGITTGWTWGQITETCEDYISPFSWEIPVKAVRCVYRADALTDDGDSGGPVFYQHAEGDSRVTLGGTVIGIWYDRMVFSKFWRIQSDLGVTLNAVCPATLGGVTLSGSLSGQAPVISWSAVSGATFYRVYRQWYRYPTEEGSGGWEMFRVTSTSFTDPSLTAQSYTGGTRISPRRAT